LWCGDSSKIAAPPLSTKAVDKFVDFLGAVVLHRRESRDKSAAIKISAVVSDAETAAYKIESGSMRDSARSPASSTGAVH
jgi:hypothetical protein